MTTKEQQTIDLLLKAVEKLRDENEKFRIDVSNQIDAMNEKTDKKHVPISLENDILRATQHAVLESVKKALTSDYNSPIKKLSLSIVDKHSDAIKNVLNECFVEVINSEEFKESVKQHLRDKTPKDFGFALTNMLAKFAANELKK